MFSNSATVSPNVSLATNHLHTSVHKSLRPSQNKAQPEIQASLDLSITSNSGLESFLGTTNGSPLTPKTPNNAGRLNLMA